MRRLAALGLALAGCLKPSAHTCAGGWTCPSGLECAETPTFCGAPAEIAACKGAADFTACSTTAVAAGYCQGAVCQVCTVDEAVCASPTWTQMTYAGGDLSSIFVRAPDSAIGVGTTTVAEWDGHAWTANDMASSDVLRSVWVPPEGGDAWIVSSANIYRWAGAALTTAYTLPATQNSALDAVWAGSQTDIYAAGTMSTIVHGNGTMFAPTTLTALRTLSGVGGSSATDVYTVGTAATVNHLEGGTWVAKTLPADVVGALHAVWASSASDVFVVGNSTTLLHFDGTTWTHSAVASDVAATWSLRSVWGSGPSDVYAVGADAALASGVILHFDGQTWSNAFASPVPLLSISGSGPHEVIAVGPSHTVLRLALP